MTFEARWNTVRPELEARALRLTSNEDDAQDLVGDTALAMIRYDAVTAMPDFRRLAFTVLGNCHIDALRARNCRPETTSLSDLDVDTSSPAPKDLTTLLLEAGFDDLSEDKREVLALKGLGLTQKEISAMVNRTVPTVKHQIDKGRELLAR